MPRFIDLSVPLEENPSEPIMPRIEYHDHQAGAKTMQAFFNCQEKDLPDGLGWSDEKIEAITHAGTHLDAPYHYHPTSEGKPARTIDQVPLEWCFCDGVVLDFRGKPVGSGITAEDVQGELSRIGYRLKPLDIVLIMTGADRFWGTPEYIFQGCGMTRESTLFLIEQGVKVMGTDAWGFDRPFNAIAKEFAVHKDRRVIWAAHYAGIEREYCHIEKLAHLDQLPSFGFTVACFPVKITRASAGWTRVVAIIPD